MTFDYAKKMLFTVSLKFTDEDGFDKITLAYSTCDQ